MKIKTIKVKNLKSISESELILNGCTAIVQAGNNKGKTTLLRGIIDRIQNEKPELIIKQGEKEGFAVMELTDGSRFEWNFTEKKEVLNYITKDNFKIDVSKGSALKDIQQKFFPSRFDIDLFLSSQPKKQVEMLQKLVGLDFTALDSEYQKYYDLRTEANRDYIRLKSMCLKKTEHVESVDIDKLKFKKSEIEKIINTQVDSIRQKNNNLRENWENENEKLRIEIQIFNNEQKEKEIVIGSLQKELEDCNLKSLLKFFDIEAAQKYIDSFEKPAQLKQFIKLPEPKYSLEITDKTELISIENEIEKAHEQNKLFAIYETELKQYNSWVEQGKAAKENALQLDVKVTEIEQKKKELIASAKFPNGFEIINGQIYVYGLPLNDKQISLSRKYIAGLQLASMELREVSSLYFDCSTLDKNSLSDVLKWANENDLQLLIEKPDFEAGDIQYQIIKENEKL